MDTKESAELRTEQDHMYTTTAFHKLSLTYSYVTTWKIIAINAVLELESFWNIVVLQTSESVREMNDG